MAACPSHGLAASAILIGPGVCRGRASTNRSRAGGGRLNLPFDGRLRPGPAEGWALMAAKKAARGNSGKTNGNGANLRFEAKLWLGADLGAANCNHVLPPCRGLQSCRRI